MAPGLQELLEVGAGVLRGERRGELREDREELRGVRVTLPPFPPLWARSVSPAGALQAEPAGKDTGKGKAPVPLSYWARPA